MKKAKTPTSDKKPKIKEEKSSSAKKRKLADDDDDDDFKQKVSVWSLNLLHRAAIDLHLRMCFKSMDYTH